MYPTNEHQAQIDRLEGVLNLTDGTIADLEREPHPTTDQRRWLEQEREKKSDVLRQLNELKRKAGMLF